MLVRLEKPEDDLSDDSGYAISKEGEDFNRILKEYYNFIIFRNKIKNELLKRTTFDYEIKLKEGVKLRYYKAYYLGPR